MQLPLVLGREPRLSNVYVCICNGVTDHQIREAAAHGCASVTELTMRTGCGSNCGSCLDMAAELLAQARAVRDFPLPLVGLASAA
ncbi:MAG: bacterioferritin-associated ferredoxin [Pseudomonas sp.]